MIKQLKSGIKTPRSRVFLLFLLFSGLAWFISRLSETYTDSIAFHIEYENAPDSLILLSAPPEELGVRVRATGFQLLRFQALPKVIDIDLNEVAEGGHRYYISPGLYRRQVESQLDNSVDLLEMPDDTIYLDFQRLRSRTVPVRADVVLEMAQNYMLDGPVEIHPPQIHLLGPPREIDTIQVLLTEPLRLTGVRDSVSRTLQLVAAGLLPNTRFSAESVTLKARVFRFSETVVDVPIEVLNKPEGQEIRTFPPAVGVLCKGEIGALKDLQASDFRVTADFQNPDPESGRLLLQIVESPEAVHSSTLLESSVEFIIRSE